MREQFPGPVALPLEATNFPPTLQLPTLVSLAIKNYLDIRTPNGLLVWHNDGNRPSVIKTGISRRGAQSTLSRRLHRGPKPIRGRVSRLGVRRSAVQHWLRLRRVQRQIGCRTV